VPPEAEHFTRREEVAHALSHGVGALLSIAGLAVLSYLAAVHGSALHVVTCTVFGAALTVVYVISTLYHRCCASPRKQLLRILDHCSIYVLIAATYTPFALVLLQGAWGWTLFGLAWGIAVLGIGLKLTPGLRDREGLSVASYLIAGWLALVAIRPMLASLDAGALWLIILGGAAYTVGVGFYCWDRLPYNHLIWHVFVLIGSALHFCAVLFYVIP
jgi:hemolysin III